MLARKEFHERLSVTRGSEFNDSLGRALYEHGSINYLGQVDSFTKNTVVARSAASLNLSAHEGFCLPVYESIRHDTLTFYGGSEWLKGFLDCPELQLGIGDGTWPEMEVLDKDCFGRTLCPCGRRVEELV